MAARPAARYWPAPERYLRERRWNDLPPAQGDAPVRDGGRRPARFDPPGSAAGRRRRLREISDAAVFDPEVPDGQQER